MADWWYYPSQEGQQVNPLWETEQIINNIRPLNDAIANMSLSEAVQYIAHKLDNGSPVGTLIVKFVENFEDTAETETDTYVIGSVNQGGGGRSGGGGAGRRGDASEVWGEYVSNVRGQVSVFGNAKETEDAIPYLVLLTKGSMLSVGVQLFLPQSVAIAALLPYAGLATTEEFWRDSAEQALEIGTTLLEYTFKGIPIKGLVPAIMDLDRQIWVDNSMLVSLQEYLNLNPLAEPDSINYNGTRLYILNNNTVGYVRFRNRSGQSTIYYNSWIFKFNQAAVWLYANSDSGGHLQAILFSERNDSFFLQMQGTSELSDYAPYPPLPNGVRRGPLSYAKSGKVVYYYISGVHTGVITGIDFSSIPISEVDVSVSLADIAWEALYGDIIDGETVDGIEKREKYTPSIPYPPFTLKNSGTLNTRQLTPITLPDNTPWVTSPSSPDAPSTDDAITPFLWPSVNQNEFVPYDPNEYPDMAYDPESATAPLPTPQNVPETQPIENPSSPGVPDISYDPSILDPPLSGGISPIIGVPDPLNWPSIVTRDTSAEHNGDPGLIHVYNPSNTEMQNFGRWLWVTYNDTTLIKIFNNPFDGVIGAHELYARPASVGVKEKIRSGFLVSDVDAYPVLVRYININCGSIVIPEYWGNYLDYAPYTKVHAYLPFIGIVELEADDIIGHSVNINYAVDAYTGACIAQITVAKDDYVNTLYEFQGNCAVEVPITGGSQAAIKAGLITAAAYGISGVIGSVGGAVSGVLGGLASTKNVAGGIVGGVMGGLSGLGETAANAINNVVSLKSSVQHSGTFGSSFGAMGIKKPYIIVKRPIQKVVPGYNQDYGYPAHKQVVIGQCQGYLKVLEINVVSPTATNDEKAQIEALLKQGVYVS